MSGDARLRIPVSRQWMMVGFVLLSSLLVSFSGEAVYQLMLYDRTGILSGEAWRLLSGHLVHTGAGHWALNAIAFAVLWWVFGAIWAGWRGILLLVFLATAISAGLLVFNPGLVWYAGLSGILHGLLAAGAVLRVLAGQRAYLLLLGVLLIKLVHEQIFGPLPVSGSLPGVPVIIDAHLYGAIAGVVAACYLQRCMASDVKNR